MILAAVPWRRDPVIATIISVFAVLSIPTLILAFPLGVSASGSP
jgi:hypothetical protein